jgi:hypothetical protein
VHSCSATSSNQVPRGDANNSHIVGGPLATIRAARRSSNFALVEWNLACDFLLDRTSQPSSILIPGHSSSKRFNYFSDSRRTARFSSRALLSKWSPHRTTVVLPHQLEANAQAIVDATCGTAPKPLIVFLPNAPFPGAHNGLRMLQVLASLPQPKRMEFAAFIPKTRTRINDDLREQMEGLRRSPKVWIAHTSLTPALQAETLKDDALIKRVVTDCFRKAPPSFVKDQKEDNPRLRRATALLGRLMLENQAPSFQQLLLSQPNEGNYKMAENILDSILKVGRHAAWGLLSISRHLQEPTNAKVRLAWDELCNTFRSAGPASGLKGVIEILRNSPYGYDANSLTLLLCAWIGFYRHDLEITLGAASQSIASLNALLNDGRPADFIEALSSKPYRILRRDRTVALLEVQSILSQVQQIATNPLTRQEANDAIVKLGEFLSHQRAAWGGPSNANDLRTDFELFADEKAARVHPERFGLLQPAIVAIGEDSFVNSDGSKGAEWFPHGGVWPEEVIIPWLEYCPNEGSESRSVRYYCRPFVGGDRMFRDPARASPQFRQVTGSNTKLVR